MADIIIDIASEFTGAKAFTKADNATAKLTSGVKKLGAAFGVTFAAAGVARFAKQSVKAFAEDEKSSVRLLKAVDNLGMGFEQTRVTQFIADLEKTAMVADDLLRPAFQSLLTTTGSVTKSQELLKLALDVSAGSTEDLATVSQDIANAYVGQTKGLKKYNLGLTAAELSTVGFAAIQEQLNQQYSGQNAARLDTYQGKLDTLNIAYGNMQETIGKGLLDSFEVLAGDAGIGGASSAMADFADFTSNAIYGLANLVSIKAPSGKTSLLGLLLSPIKDSLVAGPLGAISRYGERLQQAKQLDKPIAKTANGTPLTIAKSNADILREKIQKDAEKRAKALAAMTKAGIKAQQDAVKLAKAKATFDLQKIQIEAALKGKLSEEDAIRLKLMKAIEEENLTNIEKYQKALTVAQDKSKALNDVLATIKLLEFKDPFAEWKIDPVTAAINALTTSIGGIGTVITATGKEWSSFTGNIAVTVLKPNLSEWSSSFGKATADVTAALTTATNGITKTTADATGALVTTSKTAQSILGGLLIDGEVALTDAANAATADFGILATDTLTSVKNDLAAVTAELAAAISEAAAQAAANAADLAGAGTAGFKNNVEITVNTGIGDPNAIAEAITQVITDANNRGTLDVAGFK